uniref:SECIS binding protein 2 n=1 Tax=Amphilophus citrinellus TaxID=61819 RepID=A0A3Q0T8U9_AMPCI
ICRVGLCIILECLTLYVPFLSSQMENVAAQQEEVASGKKKRKKKKKAKSSGGDAGADLSEPAIYQEPPKFEPSRTLSQSFSQVGQHLGVTASQLDRNQLELYPTSTSTTSIPLFVVGGGLPVVQKQTSAQKKPPWQQDKIAHNPLDSTSPLVKKGKQREVPKTKKPTPLKKVILKEREERKQRRLLEERGLLPENESKLVGAPAEGLDELNNTSQIVGEGDEETDTNESVQQQISSPQLHPTNAPKIHSRKFRDYCSQILSKDVDECVTSLLKELVRFQDRLYQKDPMKARMKRRIVMGLREVLKHLKLRKIKCVIISPNCERIQSKGGLDEALHTIIDTCREQGLPFVFALSRKALGRCVNKAVPVSLVGIFNYDGAQDYYHKMIELSSEARRAYEAMISSLDQSDQAETELEAKTEEPAPNLVITQPEEPEYIKIWKQMLEKEYNYTLLNFEEQQHSMHLDDECSENIDDEES